MSKRIEELQKELADIVRKRDELTNEIQVLVQQGLRIDGAITELMRVEKKDDATKKKSNGS